MAHLHYQTAGESHGPGMIVIISGLPAGLRYDAEFVDGELTRRQGGYGRGGRQNLENDRAEVLAGVRLGETIGSPLALRIANFDSRLDDLARTPAVHTPRPGHADLAGALKYLTPDCRAVLERASARETCARVAAGAVARLLLREVGIRTLGFVRSIHQVEGRVDASGDWEALERARDDSDVYCPDPSASIEMRAAIRQAKIDKTTVGGVVEAHVRGCPPGLGSAMNGCERLDARLAGAVMGVQAIKGVEIGAGFDASRRFGHEVHDPIARDADHSGSSLGYRRSTNNAGGLEGGMTTGSDLVVRAAMKPISTVLRGMPSVDLRTGAPAPSAYERSDICAVPACSVVVENVVAFEVAVALREKFGGDSLREMLGQFALYVRMAGEV